MKKPDNRTSSQIEIAKQKAELRREKRVVATYPRNRKDGGSKTIQERLE